jgi:EpsG family
MFIYMALLVVISIIYIACFKIENIEKQTKVFLLLSSIPLILLMGMRDKSIGTDTIQYYTAFKNITTSKLGWLDYKETRYEVGYYLLNKIVGLFTQNPQIFLFVVSIIIVAGILLFIYKNPINPFMSVMLFQTLYFYGNSFNLLRQYIAIAIAINSFSYIKERKILKASLIIILASTFHTSALCLLPITIILSKLKINHSNIKWFILVITSMSLCIPLLINLTVKIFPRYEYYLTYHSNYNGGKIMPYIFISMVLVGLIIIRKLKISDLTENNYYLLSIYVYINAILGIVSNIYFESASRIMVYYSIFLIAFIPELLKLFNNLFDNMTKKLIIQYGLLFFTFVYYVLLLHSGVGEITPYTIFGK